MDIGRVVYVGTMQLGGVWCCFLASKALCCKSEVSLESEKEVYTSTKRGET